MFQSVNILHVIDDEKFIPFCEETFNLQGIENKYASSGDFSKVLISSFDIIILHYLNREKAAVLNKKEIKTPIIWFFWGGDGFLLGRFSAKFLQPKTKFLFLKLAFKRNIIEGIKAVRKLSFPILSDFLSYNKEIIKAFKKIDIIVPVMPGDYILLKQKYEIKADMFHLNYVIPSINKAVKERGLQVDNILLGNSASYSNNHIEAINLLSKLSLGECKVIIPLSYGDEQYADYINRYADKLLNNRSLCLREFIPINEYMQIMEKCSIVIMNHERQQALGNIAPLLAQGSHIYLNEKSSLYNFLKEKGFYISKINEIKNLRILNTEERYINNSLCLHFFGKERQHKKVNLLIEKIIQTF